MIESRLITKKNQIEHELKLMKFAPKQDPQRKQRLLSEANSDRARDIVACGFSKEEIERNEFALAGQTVKSQSYLIDPAGIESGTKGS
jgi:hypothetical protein